MLVPFIVLPSVLFGSIIASMIKRRSFKQGLKVIGSLTCKKYLNDRLLPLFLLLVIAMFSFLVSSSLSPLKCISVSNGVYMMRDNPSIQCFTPEWRSQLGPVVFFINLYCVVLPSGLVFILWRNRHSLHSQDFQASLGSITNPYEDKFFWWELAIVFKKAVFVVTTSFLSVKQQDNLFASVAILLGFMNIESGLKPFKNHMDLFKSST
jgi:hypothetical protein